MRVAITGGTGFIGKRLIQQCLKEGWRIRILSRNAFKTREWSKDFEIIHGDLRDPGLDLEDFLRNQDVLINCAAEVVDDSRMWELHVEGCRRLIEAARGNVSQWLQLSSVGVYGRPRAGTITEDSIQAPFNVYEQTKAISETLVIQAAENGAFTYTIVRPAIVYGQEMSNDSLRGLIRAIQKGRFFFIGPPGGQTAYVHVEDVVMAMIECIKNSNARNRIYNVSRQCSVEELVFEVCEISKIETDFKRVPIWCAKLIAHVGALIPGFPLTSSRVDALTTRVIYDTSRIQNELRIRPQISLRQGLTELINPSMRNGRTCL